MGVVDEFVGEEMREGDFLCIHMPAICGTRDGERRGRSERDGR